jgi:hypothetical protein
MRKLARSPLLHFMPGPYRYDVCTLFDGILANAPTSKETGVTTPRGFIQGIIGERQAATIHGLSNKSLFKIARLAESAEEVRRSTGQHALYVGYPCVIVPAEAGKSKLAPLFLFPINLVIKAKRLLITRHGLEVESGNETPEAGEAIFNRLLAAYVKREHGIALGTTEARYSIDPQSFDGIVTDVLSSWPGVAKEGEFPSVSACLSKEDLRKITHENDDPRVMDYAVLGLADFTGQALLDDLDRIETALRDGEPCSAPLAMLLTPKNFKDIGSVQFPQHETEKWLVDKSDPSQEAVVWAQRQAPLVVLQGPPGTGKSQTIVNVVADALSVRQSVLVVCQKHAATEVVRKRLKAVGLGELCALIDDLDSDRSSLIRRIKEIESDYTQDIRKQNERIRLADNILRVETDIDAGIGALNDDSQGATYPVRDLRSLLGRLSLVDGDSLWSSELLQEIKRVVEGDFARFHLTELLEKIRTIDNQTRTLEYGKNTWSNVAPSLDEDASALERLQSALRKAARIACKLEARTLIPVHDSETAWIAFNSLLRSSDGLLQFAGSEDKQQAAKEMNEWHEALSTIERWKPELIALNEINGALGSRYSAKGLQRLERDAEKLGDIAALRRTLDKSPLLREINKALKVHIGNWERQVHALVLQEWKDKLLRRRTTEFQKSRLVSPMCEELSDYLVKKQKADVASILAMHSDRVAARDKLSERDLLRLRGHKKIPKTSLRKLYVSGASEIRRTQPILLTSPETASALLPLKPESFDLAVIDEASQMFVAEAIPMLYRAKRAIVAGDRMQMPPSDFFSFGDDLDVDESINVATEIEDAELPAAAAADGTYRLLDAADEALGSNSVYRKHLEVHYRSARKELIDFSNHAFYDGRLIIPSGNAELPWNLNSAITFEQTAGSFERGVNNVEASRIVELLVDLWSIDPPLKSPSVGVIVNNIKQKALIETLLAEYAENNQSFGLRYSEERSRDHDGEDVSFFVRSVESVQGDERDLIIFGGTYSGSKRGFGPLTAKDDGRKRLNVAVTRAKRAMIVLCSLNLAHTSNEAERETHERYFFWQYLRYARAISKHDLDAADAILTQLNPERTTLQTKCAETDSPFEDEVKEFVESLGYCVVTQVGESGFKIDLGVKLKHADLNYLCGIECDGARFHSGWTARTRDVWRQGILEDKGWKIARIWSTKWFEEQAQTKDKLEAVLKRLSEEQPSVQRSSTS